MGELPQCKSAHLVVVDGEENGGQHPHDKAEQHLRQPGGEAHRPVGGGGETVGQQADQAAGQVGYRGVQAGFRLWRQRAGQTGQGGLQLVPQGGNRVLNDLDVFRVTKVGRQAFPQAPTNQGYQTGEYQDDEHDKGDGKHLLAQPGFDG